MQHFHNVEEIHLEESWLTIGSFDGVHLGHQQIIRDLVKGAHDNGQPAVVVTFHPHPQLIIKKEGRPFYLTLPGKRAQLLGDLGVDIVLTYPFSSETSQMRAKEFIALLHQRLQFSRLWVGYDFALGRNREGDPAYLKNLGQQFGYALKEILPYSIDGELVSSSRIRKSIREGEMREAAALLGRPFEVTGTVVVGENRGKSLGFATSNLDVPQEIVDIKPGVYACLTDVDGQTWKAVTNIGFRPTFGDGILSPRIEAHLLEFSGSLYGEELSLKFVERLRDEMKFDQVSALQAQIKADIDQALQIFGEE
ncbi:MAG: bifunctional riboflavin kinase/FAD synthetase [Anaerolineales bacterium]|nr:bifunctional riboflavin kinase/FAD synthetase [Anaerolineales bacterium]